MSLSLKFHFKSVSDIEFNAVKVSEFHFLGKYCNVGYINLGISASNAPDL